VTIQKSSNTNTPRLAKKLEANIHQLITDGEENISEEDDEIESSKHEAKLMAARINDTM
jgi:siroheme synthase (precorrin-2 oxidase/ferrochelatase)